MSKEITIENLVNRVHSWKEVYVRNLHNYLSIHERDEFDKRRDEFALLIIQILEEKMGIAVKLKNGGKD